MRSDTITDRMEFGMEVEVDAATAGAMFSGALGGGLTAGFATDAMPAPAHVTAAQQPDGQPAPGGKSGTTPGAKAKACLVYTTDAADELTGSVAGGS